MILLKKLTQLVGCIVLTGCLVILVYYTLHIKSVQLLWDEDFILCQAYREEHSKTSKDLSYVTISLHGRLGNWMYSYASLLGIAARTNHVAFLSERHPLHATFKLSSRPQINLACMETVKEKWGCAFDRDLLNIPPVNVTIGGFLQSWKYFQNFENKIRSEFQFRNDISSSASEHFSKTVFPRKHRTYICVHVRRTDMMIPSSIKRGFTVAPLLYLEKAVVYMAKKFANSTFFVVSDDRGWSTRNLNFPGYDLVFSPQTYVSELDLCLLSLCNHSIITVGTFGWWGAWLAGGHTVYYENFPIRGSPLDREFKAEDFFPPQWIALGIGTNLVCMKSVLFYTFLYAVVLGNIPSID